jgi:putative ABC transport system permease protein
VSVALRIAGRELRGGLRGFRIFLACLALGVAAIAAVGSVREAIQEGLSREGATILGGDAEMSFTYRFASDTERAHMDRIAEDVSETVDFRSMVIVDPEGEPDRALTQVRGVDGAYPLYGEVVLDPAMPLAEALATDGLPGIVMQRLLVDRLALTWATRCASARRISNCARCWKGTRRGGGRLRPRPAQHRAAGRAGAIGPS